MAVFLALLVLAFTLTILILKYRHGYWRRRKVPHNEPIFPWGDITEWRKTKSFFQIVTPIYKKFKGQAPFAGMYMAFKPVAVILDIELVKNILVKDFNNFRDRGLFYNEKDDPLTAHLFFLDGSKWRDMRQKLTQAFTTGKMKNMFPTVLKVAEELAKVLEEKQASAPNGVIEMVDITGRFTSDVIGTCAFGIECNSLRNPTAEFVVMGQKSLVEHRYPKLIASLKEVTPKLARLLRMRHFTQEVHDFYIRLVGETMAYREKNSVMRNDFMNILLELKKSGELTVDEAAAQAYVFLLAGYETTASTIGFALYELAKHQDIQDKLRAEINRVIAEHNNEFTYETMKDMKYLGQVFDETLRMYPILPRLVREAQADYPTNDPRYTIEKGTMLEIPVYDIQRDPEYFPNPDKFDPEHFTEAAIKKRPTCAWIPFGDGPRSCIGLRFARMQGYIGMAYLLRNFKFTFSEETDAEIIYSIPKIFLTAENGIKLRVERI